MSTDLRDQLQKLGLVSATDVEHHDKRPAGGGRARAAKLAKADKSNARPNRRAKVADKAPPPKPGELGLDGKLITPVSSDLPPKQRVMELVKHHGCNDKNAKQEYFFTDSTGAVRSAPANKKQQQQLAEGVLAVVKPQQNRDPYVLVPAAVAEQIASLIPERIVLWHR